MTKKYLLIYLTALSLLTACGEKINHTSISSDDAIAVISTDTVELDEKTVSNTVTTGTPAISEMPENAVIETVDSIEVYERITLNELISNTNVELRNGNKFIDTSNVGVLKTLVSYNLDGKLYEHEIEYSVSDTTPPVLLNSGGSAVALLGESFDLSNFVGFSDNYDPVPVLTYEGWVDTNSCGVYPLTATATDCFGNSTTWELSVKVAETAPEPIDDNERISFDTLKTQYGDENSVFGIDVSKWQGSIDFDAVKAAGCSFVIMRIGSYYDEYTIDPYFTSNMQSAVDSGLDVGVYIYTTANTEEEVKDNADWIIQQLNGQELDFPIVFDWEHFSTFQQYEMSIYDLNNYFEVFADELEKQGYSAMLYSSKNFLNNFWYEHSEYPIWLAHYTDYTDYTGEYAMWQMTAYGKIDGIQGDVDFNILYKDKFIN